VQRSEKNEVLMQPKQMTRKHSPKVLAKYTALDGIKLGSEPAADNNTQLQRLAIGQPLDIPLCRLITMEVVRSIMQDDIEDLQNNFIEKHYISSAGGLFYTSLQEFGTEEVVDVTSEQFSSWDPIWQRKSKEFDEFLLTTKNEFLVGKMLWVWEGNHRCRAWMQTIHDLYMDREDRHISVKTQVLDGKLENQVLILQGCQDVNE
jgi:hypothetical protein